MSPDEGVSTLIDEFRRMRIAMETIAVAVSNSPTITGVAVSKKRRRVRRPDPRRLNALIVAHSGNVKAIAEELGVARNTAIKWLEPFSNAVEMARALNRSGRERSLNDIDIERTSERRSRDQGDHDD